MLKTLNSGSVVLSELSATTSTAGTDPGKPTVCELENGPFVVDLPVEHDDFPWLCYLTMENHHL